MLRAFTGTYVRLFCSPSLPSSFAAINIIDSIHVDLSDSGRRGGGDGGGGGFGDGGFADEGYAAEPLPPPPTPVKVRDSHS